MYIILAIILPPAIYAQAMHAHSQFCWTGDNTVEATQAAISSMAQEPAEERFVIVVSDANFSRHRIDPREFGSLMTADPSVNVFAVFIGSLGDQAMRLDTRRCISHIHIPFALCRLREVLPAGRSFICMDTKDLPLILQQIFSSLQ